MADIQFYCDLLAIKKWYLDRLIVGLRAKLPKHWQPLIQCTGDLNYGMVLLKDTFEITTNKRIRVTWRTIDFEEWMPSTNLTLDLKTSVERLSFYCHSEKYPRTDVGTISVCLGGCVHFPPDAVVFCTIKAHNK